MARTLFTSRKKAAQIEGLPELQKRLAAVIDRATGERIKKAQMAAAIRLRDAIKATVPIAEESSNVGPAGALQSAIRAKYGDRTKNFVTVYIDRKVAPQALWLEYGTNQRFTKQNGANRGKVPSIGFWRSGIRKNKAAIIQQLAEGYRRILTE